MGNLLKWLFIPLNFTVEYDYESSSSIDVYKLKNCLCQAYKRALMLPVEVGLVEFLEIG